MHNCCMHPKNVCIDLTVLEIAYYLSTIQVPGKRTKYSTVLCTSSTGTVGQ